MLKCCIKPLVTLVLALVATGFLSTLCPARVLRSPDGSPAVRATSIAKPGPAVTSGEPDTPLGPPPTAHLGGGYLTPVSSDQDSGGVLMTSVRWISAFWASWFARAAI